MPYRGKKLTKFDKQDSQVSSIENYQLTVDN